MKKLFVGGLSWNTDEEILRNTFEKYGKVEDARVITDRDTGRSRGFGFVTFEQAEDAETAVREMDDTQLDGRTIRVNEAHEKPRNNNNRGGGNRGRW